MMLPLLLLLTLTLAVATAIVPRTSHKHTARHTLSLVNAHIQAHTDSDNDNRELERETDRTFVSDRQTDGHTSASSSLSRSRSRARGAACILGGALAHLTLGTLYCWGNFLSYAPPHLRYFSDSLSLSVSQSAQPPDALYVLPLTLVAQACSMPLGPLLVRLVGASRTVLLGAWLSAAAVYIASFQTRLLPFIAAYSLLFGTGAGLAYTAPMTAGWKWLPHCKGLVSGGVLAGFGAGGFVFSMIGSRIVNPNGVNPVNGKFPQAIYDAFPLMLRRLALMYAVVAFAGSMLVSEPPLKPNCSNQSSTTDGLSVVQSLKTSQFWLMWAMVISSATAGLNTAAIYKQYAATSNALDGDAYQAMVGGIGALFNGVGRLLWGLISDRIGFKSSFTILTMLQTILMLTYGMSSSSKALFGINTCLIYFCLAGNLSLMPPATVRMFGPKAGTTTYGILYSAFAIASIVGGMLTKSMVKSYGYNTVFQVMAVMSFLATIMVNFLRPTSHYKQSQM